VDAALPIFLTLVAAGGLALLAGFGLGSGRAETAFADDVQAAGATPTVSPSATGNRFGWGMALSAVAGERETGRLGRRVPGSQETLTPAWLAESALAQAIGGISRPRCAPASCALLAPSPGADRSNLFRLFQDRFVRTSSGLSDRSAG